MNPLELAGALLAVSCLGWSVWCHHRAHVATAWAALLTGTVLAVGPLASLLGISAWAEGGVGMPVLSLVGGYALGTALGFRLTGRRAPRVAALVGLVFTLAASAFFYRDAMGGVERAVEHAPPDVAELIIAASRGEAVRLLQWGGVLIGGIVALLLARARPSPQLVTSTRRERSANAL